jgi:hypothetical protein
MFGSSFHGGWFVFATSNNDWVGSRLKLGILYPHIVFDLGFKIHNHRGINLQDYSWSLGFNVWDLAV